MEIHLSEFVGKQLSGVSFENYEFSGKSFQAFDSITLHFSDRSVTIVPVVDSDEIAIRVGVYDEKKEAIAFSKYIGKSLTCVWVGKNEKGYFDLLTFSFENLHPSLAILSEGSSLKIFSLGQV